MAIARVLIGTAIVWWALASLGRAQEPRRMLVGPYLAIGGRVAPVADVDLHTDPITFEGAQLQSRVEHDSLSSIAFGGELSYTHPLDELFALGARYAAYTYEMDFEPVERRDVALTLSVAPQARLKLSSAVEGYFSLAIGAGLLWTGETERQPSQAPDGSSEPDIAIGWHFAPMLGMRIAAGGGFGTYFEFGAALHGFYHELEGPSGLEEQFTTTTNTTIEQLVLTLGMFYDLGGS